MFVRHHLNQSGSGESTLQLIMIQVDVQWYPKPRNQNDICS